MILLFLELTLITVFSTTDLLVFFVSFEMLLPPMMFLIGEWGPRQRRVKANYYFIFYTLLGSLFMLFALVVIYFETGTTNILFLSQDMFEVEKQKIL